MRYYYFMLLFLVVMVVVSLFVGFSSLSLARLWAGDAHAWLVLSQTRLPRTFALILVGGALALAGTIMQMLARNRFVEPATSGTVEFASLGILFVMIFAPSLPIIVKILISASFAFMGALVFMGLLRMMTLKSALVVPLIGIMLGYIVGAFTNAIADYYLLLPSLQAYLFASFSMIIEGKYELLFLVFPLCFCAYLLANRFTVTGLGEGFAHNLGLDYRKLMFLGLFIVALITAVVVSTVGRIPFVGLVVPNIVSLLVGDNLRHNLPWVTMGGALLVLFCDVFGRLISPAFEIPLATMMGVVGSSLFIGLLIYRRGRLG
ncbi:ABC transporter permease [Bartonella sp. DGB2]|uniref:ABC transporter permease n=1 Tax=Bartonella sp. DGB2 TaxID=3388426 RepID=UPI00399028B2